MVKTSSSYPVPRIAERNRFKYPWKFMELGESFSAEVNSGQRLTAHVDSIRGQCCNWRRKLGRTFVFKAQEGEKPGCRVWRTS